MEVTFELYGDLRRLAGAPELRLRLDAETGTVAEALAALAHALPAVATRLPQTAVAVGDALARRSDPLPRESRLALLPPVAGG